MKLANVMLRHGPDREKRLRRNYELALVAGPHVVPGIDIALVD